LESIFDLYYKLESKSIDNFNIFKILNLEYDEVRLHSAILKYYIEKDIDGFLQSIPDVCWSNKVKPTKDQFEEILIEEPIYSDLENLGDGRIDILIKFKIFSIIIENKIYAKDQDHQLIKYHNYGRILGNDFLLLYLTPMGKLPNSNSIEPDDQLKNKNIRKLEINESFHLFSYKYHVINWLKDYLNDFKENNSERAILIQYIDTLNKICEIMETEQKNRIIALLKNNELSNKLFSIKNDIQTIENIIHKFWGNVASKIALESFDYISNDPNLSLSTNFKEGSIMLDLFNKGRGYINFYLEYTTNFEEAPFIGIWGNKNYLEKFKSIIRHYRFNVDQGFIDKNIIKDLFNEKVIINYLNDNEEKDISTIVKSINEYLINKLDLINHIKKELT